MRTLIHRYPLSKDEKKLLCYFFRVSVKDTEEAAECDDALFNKLYNYELKKFLEDEPSHIKFCHNELRSLNKQINNPFISPNQKAAALATRNNLINTHFFLFKDEELQPYDQLEGENIFRWNFYNLVEEFKNILPQELLEKIADIRVYSLGYATQENINLFHKNLSNILKNLELSDQQSEYNSQLP